MGCGLQVGNGRSPDGNRAPLKSRTTWAGDEMAGTVDQSRQRISRRRTVAQHLDGGREDSPEPGKIKHVWSMHKELALHSVEDQ